MLGDMIKKRREQIGMSQDELAQKVGYKSRSSINKIELNKQDLTQSQVTKIANALNVPVGYLLGDKNDNTKGVNKEFAFCNCSCLCANTSFFLCNKKLPSDWQSR